MAVRVPAAGEQMQRGAMIQHTRLPARPALKIEDPLSLQSAHGEKRAGESPIPTEEREQRRPSLRIPLDQRKIRCQRCSQFDIGSKERKWSLIHHNEPQGAEGPQRRVKY